MVKEESQEVIEIDKSREREKRHTESLVKWENCRHNISILSHPFARGLNEDGQFCFHHSVAFEKVRHVGRNVQELEEDQDLDKESGLEMHFLRSSIWPG